MSCHSGAVVVGATGSAVRTSEAAVKSNGNMGLNILGRAVSVKRL